MQKNSRPSGDLILRTCSLGMRQRNHSSWDLEILCILIVLDIDFSPNLTSTSSIQTMIEKYSMHLQIVWYNTTWVNATTLSTFKILHKLLITCIDVFIFISCDNTQVSTRCYAHTRNRFDDSLHVCIYCQVGI